MNKGYSNRSICDAVDVRMPVDSFGLNRSYVAFDFLKIVNGRPFYADRHLKRFFHSMEVLRIRIGEPLEEVLAVVESIAAQGELSYYGLKFFAVPMHAEVAEDGYYDADLFIVPVEIPIHPPEFFEKGSKLITFEYTRFLPGVKSTNYLASVYWEPEVKRSGAIEPLFVCNGRVLETARSNCFICRERTVIANERDVLAGVTRSVVLDIAREHGITVEIRDYTLDELYHADEVFVTSTTKGVAPIVLVNESMIGNGNVGTLTSRLFEGYRLLTEF